MSGIEYHTIAVRRSKAGYVASCGDRTASVDGSDHHPGVAALALAERMTQGRPHKLCRRTSWVYDLEVGDGRATGLVVTPSGVSGSGERAEALTTSQEAPHAPGPAKAGTTNGDRKAEAPKARKRTELPRIVPPSERPVMPSLVDALRAYVARTGAQKQEDRQG